MPLAGMTREEVHGRIYANGNTVLMKTEKWMRGEQKMRSYIMSVVCVALLLTVPLVTGAEEDKIDITVGGGLVISPGYNDVLKDAYSHSSVSGGWGWLDMQLGVRFNATPNLSFCPSLDLLLNFVSGSDTYANTIILPSIAVRYMFQKAPSIYLTGEVNYGLPNTGGDRIDADAGGVGFGGAIGYALDTSMNFELGYVNIPVEIGTRDEDFGGVRLKVGASF